MRDELPDDIDEFKRKRDLDWTEFDKMVSDKSPEMEDALDSMSQSFFGRKRTTSISDKVCVTCGNGIGEFRDVLSRKEYSISGMCQNCQDEVFG